jgi:type II secretory pathway pseudopilin PulG
MKRNPGHSSAFTIVELLIAAAITVGIVVMLGSMFGSLIRTTSKSTQRIDAFRDARSALQMMERDFAGLTRAAPAAHFALDDRYTGDPNTKPIKNRQIYALIAAKNAGPGDICAVGYYCRWDGKSYTLRRYFRDSNELMADGSYFTSNGRTIPTWNILANGVGKYMPSDKLYQPSDTDAPKASPPTFKDEVLASYVWNFQITAYKADGTVDTTYPLIIDPSDPTKVVPAALEISFYAVSPQAARVMMSASPSANDWMDTTSANFRLVAPSKYEFRTRINL